MISYSLGRSLHQSGLDSAASHHRHMWCQYSNRHHTWTGSLNSDQYTLWAENDTIRNIKTKLYSSESSSSHRLFFVIASSLHFSSVCKEV